MCTRRYDESFDKTHEVVRKSSWSLARLHARHFQPIKMDPVNSSGKKELVLICFQALIMRGSVSSQVGYILSHLEGRGLSKSKSRAVSFHTSLDGIRPVSEKIHSHEYRDEVYRTGRDLGDFAREFGVKDYSKIDGHIVADWIQEKVASGVSRNVLKNYIAHLAKIEIGLQKIASLKGCEREGFRRGDLVAARETIAKLAQPEPVNRSYLNPGAIISNLSGGAYIAGRLQLDHGLRVTEATHIRADQLTSENVLTVQGKGGYIQVKNLPSDLAQAIRDHMKDGKFEVSQNQYRDQLQESARIEGEDYNGSHGLRYNFAQRTYVERLEENLAKGMEHKAADRDALAYTSKELGHHREEITHRYL